jgi:hypothetical protein
MDSGGHLPGWSDLVLNDPTVDLGPFERGAVRRRQDEVTLPDRAETQRPAARAGAHARPRATRVRHRASFWVAHSVGLSLAAGLLLGLASGLLVWRLGSDQSSSSRLQTDQSMSAPAGYSSSQLLLDDNFAGANLDATHWNTYLGAQGAVWNNYSTMKLPYSAPNASASSDTSAMLGPDQVSVHNGLTLTAQHNPTWYSRTYPWISGVLTTQGKISLPSSGWYVQVKAKMPDMTNGMWPAIWFMPDQASSHVPEIDLFEGGWRGSNPNDIIHMDYGGGASEYAGYRDIVYDTGSDLTAGFHVYGIQYIPNVAVKYYFDGKMVFEQKEDDPGGVATGSYELLLELQVASQQASPWHTQTSATTPSATMDIAEVQAYL